MDRRNSSKFDTAFTTSIEAKEGITTGISAADRSTTIQTAIDDNKNKNDISTRGISSHLLLEMEVFYQELVIQKQL